MAEPFGVEAYDFCAGRVVAPCGELDAATCPQLIGYLLVQPGRILVVDLSQLTFMDSSGLGALVVARTKALKHEASLVVSRGSPAISRLLEITGLSILEVDWDPAWEKRE